MAKKKLIDWEILREAAPTLRTVSHPERLRIIDYLRDDEKTVGQIAEAAEIGQALTSQHLARMKDKGVVAQRREGNKRYYRLENKNVLLLLDCIQMHCKIK